MYKKVIDVNKCFTCNLVEIFHHDSILDWQVYDSVGSIFSTGWLIAGSVYVYGAAPTYEDHNLPSYCEYSAYMYETSLSMVHKIFISSL